jgi:cobalt-zinc-cadmium efflux system outer membrane protein
MLTPLVRIVRVAAAGAALLAGGCVTIPREAGFADVERAVAERTGHRVHWNQGTPSDQAVEAQVRALLRTELTADHAVQVALLNNRALQATYEDLSVAQADLVAAGLLRNPVFDAQVRFNTAGGGTGVDVGIVQDFMDVLAIPLRKRVAAATFEAVKARVAGQVMDLAGEAHAAFVMFQASQQSLDLRRQVLAAAEASYDVARRLRAAGNTRALDLLAEQTLYEQAKLDARSAEAQVARDRERLNELMGLWAEPAGAWTAAARLPELPADDPAAAGGPATDVERQAVERSLDLQAGRLEVDVAARSLGLKVPFGLLPDAEVGAAAEREVEGGWSVGPAVSLPIPLFNQGQPALAVARAELRRARQRYAATAVAVRARTRAARESVVAANDEADHYRRVILPLRQQVVDQTQLQYNAMQVSPLDLLRARQQQVEGGAAYVRSLRAYWLARGELDQILSGRLPPADRGTAEMADPMTSSSPADGRGGH